MMLINLSIPGRVIGHLGFYNIIPENNLKLCVLLTIMLSFCLTLIMYLTEVNDVVFGISIYLCYTSQQASEFNSTL